MYFTIILIIQNILKGNHIFYLLKMSSKFGIKFNFYDIVQETETFQTLIFKIPFDVHGHINRTRTCGWQIVNKTIDNTRTFISVKMNLHLTIFLSSSTIGCIEVLGFTREHESWFSPAVFAMKAIWLFWDPLFMEVRPSKNPDHQYWFRFCYLPWKGTTAAFILPLQEDCGI